MSYLFDNVPMMRCFVRGEYLRDLDRGHGEYIKAIAHAVRCRRGSSLWFQVNLFEPYGGMSFLLPITALTWRPDVPPVTVADVQPWDCMGTTFSVCEMAFVARGGVQILPKRQRGQYRYSIDFGAEDLADDPAQHKTLHVVYLDGGAIGAFPNNRTLWEDSAFWDVIEQRPDVESLLMEVRAEGNQSLFDR